MAARIIRLSERDTKTKTARTLPLNAELMEMFTIAKQDHDQNWPLCEWVFHRAGERICDFCNAWRTACKLAGFWDAARGQPTKLFHDFRRSAVRNLTRAAVSQTPAMAISGHQSASVFRRYDIVDESDLREAAERAEHYERKISTEFRQKAPEQVVQLTGANRQALRIQRPT